MKKNNTSLLVCACVLTALVCVEFTAMMLVVTPVAHTFVISLAQSQWIISIYYVTFAAIVIIGGRLGDIYGEKTILLIGIGLFVCASLIGGLSHSFIIIMLSRFIQALGAALIYPNNIALLLKEFPQEKHGSILGIYGSIVGLSITLGPMIGGLITHYFSWRWVFLINVPFGLACLLMVTVLQKNQLTLGKKPKLDLWGALLLMLAIAAFVFAIDKLNIIFQHPFFIIGAIVVSSIASYLFLFFAKRARDPLISFHVCVQTLGT